MDFHEVIDLHVFCEAGCGWPIRPLHETDNTKVTVLEEFFFRRRVHQVGQGQQTAGRPDQQHDRDVSSP